ncbi:2283_t:CDS:10 [Acaulospora morrowiae]|uniref:2283_t:CDS:1 n=1 Tax=Acaulospora morrowiae TaxID=94023 RepID=A0A9N9FEN1_9GLOM|nr:2283_t:CDS:10 [Acaulospora morrowiae]
MASNVVVLLPNGKRQTVKTTPMMTLKQIVITVCEKQSMTDVENWGLKQNKKTLDLGLSVRFANLAPGAKLDLIRITAQKVHSDVQVALQLDDGGRLIGKFPITSSLWDILIHFESSSQDGSLNLTRRTAPVPKKKTLLKKIAGQSKDAHFYQQPVLLRLLFRNTESSLEDVLNDIITPLQVPKNNTISGDTAVATVPTEPTDKSKKIDKEKSNSEDHLSVVPTGSIDESPKNDATTLTEITDRIDIEQSNSEVNSLTVPDSTDGLSKMDLEQNIESMEIDSNLPDQAPTTLSTDDDVIKPSFEQIHISENNDVSETSHPSVVQTMADPINQSPERGYFDRNVKVFNPLPEKAQFPTQIDLPDSFYELTASELQFLLAMQNSKRVAQENVGFKTSKVRAQEQEEKERKYPKTLIRVKFPDGFQLQVAFMSKEKVSSLYEFVKNALRTPHSAFELYTTPPKKILSDQNLTLFHAELSPASVVYFIWLNKFENDSEPYLSEEYLKLREDIPHLQTTVDVNASIVPNDTTIKQENVGHKLSETSHQDGSSVKKKSKSQSEGSGSNRSLPKWFRKKQ